MDTPADWSNVDYSSAEPKYPHVVLKQDSNGHVILPDTHTQPHPVHVNDEFSTLLLTVPFKRKPAHSLQLRLTKANQTLIVAVNKHGQPVPTPKNAVDIVLAARRAPEEAARQLASLLSQPEVVLTAFVQYVKLLQKGHAPTVKSYMDLILPLAVSATEGTDDTLKKVETRDLLKLLKLADAPDDAPGTP